MTVAAAVQLRFLLSLLQGRQVAFMAQTLVAVTVTVNLYIIYIYPIFTIFCHNYDLLCLTMFLTKFNYG